MDIKTDGHKDRLTYGQTNIWIDGQVYRQTNRWIGVQMKDGQMDRWIDGQMDKWTNGQIDSWT